jgi:putative nucleotidyltransferase with HDIG domain
MQTCFVNVWDLKRGMILAEAIYNSYGAVIVGEETEVDDNLISKLDALNINRVKVYRQDEASRKAAEVTKEYTENIGVIKDIIYDISVGKSLKMEVVNNVSETVCSRVNDAAGIVNCLNEIRGVDEYTYTHSMNVSLLSMLITKWLGCSEEKIKLATQAGLLHDIGKSKIDQNILIKPAKLTDEEFEEMKKHPVYGYKICEKTPGVPREVCMAVLMHHEREDGSGYPMMAKGHQISDLAKIVAVADVYDAMTSNRAHRARVCPFEVFSEMLYNFFGNLDINIVKVFVSNMANFYIGEYVKLNSDEIGEIVHINPRDVSRPLIRIDNAIIDLMVERNLKIIELV